MIQRLAAGILLATALTSPLASANVGDTYGFGSRSGALAGATAAWGFDGYAAYSNPAALALNRDKRMVVSWGVVDMVPDFIDINNVVTQNEFNADGEVVSNVANDYRATFGQALGVGVVLLPETMRLSLGVNLFFPLAQIAYVDSGEMYIPEYGLHRSRTLRPQLDFGLGARMAPKLYFGAGFRLAYSLTTNATVFLNAAADRTSSTRVTASIKPRASPVLSLLYLTDDKVGSPAERTDSSSIGLVVRLESTNPNEITARSSARLFGSLAALDVNFNGMSMVFFDPMSIELGTALQLTSGTRVYLQSDYQVWSSYEPSAIRILDPQVTTCTTCGGGIVVSPSRVPSYDFRDIWVPRAAVEFGETTLLRFGYGFKPSIQKSLPTEAGNFLDPSKHMFTAGMGFKTASFLGYSTPANIDLHAAYHQLVTQEITKSAGDERGTGAGRKIGAPGYRAGGKILGGGVSLTLAF